MELVSPATATERFHCHLSSQQVLPELICAPSGTGTSLQSGAWMGAEPQSAARGQRSPSSLKQRALHA